MLKKLLIGLGLAFGGLLGFLYAIYALSMIGGGSMLIWLAGGALGLFGPPAFLLYQFKMAIFFLVAGLVCIAVIKALLFLD